MTRTLCIWLLLGLFPSAAWSDPHPGRVPPAPRPATVKPSARPATAPPAARPTPAQPATRPAMDQLLATARQLSRLTSQLRGLRLRRPLAMGVQSRQEILRRIEEKLAREYSPAEIAAESALLQGLGLLPAGLDYRATLLALLQEQVAGFYDPQEQKLYLADWIDLSLQEPALVHEICHALQDQHFRLKQLTRPLKQNADRQLARLALLEGDCMGVMLEHTLAPRGLDLSSMGGNIEQSLRGALSGAGNTAIRQAPPFLRETLLFPYLGGLRLIQRTRALHPWSVVSRMFRRPPESTEQVLHPEKYWSREQPVPVNSAPLPALAGWQRIKEDVLGELQLGILLAPALDRAGASRAAAGWSGDLAQALRREGEPGVLVVHLSRWDSEADALEFSNAARRLLAQRQLTRRPAADPAIWVFADDQGREWSVQLRGQLVLLLHGAPASLRPALQGEVWSHWRVGGKRIPPPSPPSHRE